MYCQSIEQKKVISLSDSNLRKYAGLVLKRVFDYKCTAKKVYMRGLDKDGVLHLAVLCYGGKEFAIYIYGDRNGTIQSTTCDLYKAIEGVDCWD